MGDIVNRGTKVAIVLAMVLVAGAVYIVYQEPKDVTRGDLTVSGTLGHGDVTVDEYAGVGTLTYNGDGDVIEWHLMDLEGSAYMPDGTARGFTDVMEGKILALDSPCHLEVKLVVDGKEVHRGTVTMLGTEERSFEWIGFSGYTYSVTLGYGFSDYLQCSGTGFDGRTDGSIDGVEGQLRTVFERNHGRLNDHDMQDYVDFLLIFVQCCIEQSMDDGLLYGMEYTAHPLETLHHGVGDADDTQVLFAHLASAAGMLTGMADVQGHIMTAVGLDSFVPRNVDGMDLASKHLDSQGQNLFFCDTVSDVPAPAGYLDSKYIPDIMGLERITFLSQGVTDET